MKSYQILFNQSGPTSQGENFKAKSPCDAILEFYTKYPKATLIGLFDIEALSWFQINRAAIMGDVEHDDRSRKIPDTDIKYFKKQ